VGIQYSLKSAQVKKSTTMENANMLIVYDLLGISPASDCVFPTFRNPLSGPSSKAVCGIFIFILHIQPLKMDLTEGSETSAKHNLTPGKYPKEYIQYSEHGESLKSS
jgi:hypothetical protein